MPTHGVPRSALQRLPFHLLWPLLTSAIASQRLTTPVAQGTIADLPGYHAPTFTLMPVGSTSCLAVQVSGFDDLCRLTQTCRLISASCSSSQRFAFGFLQIRSRPRHPCRSANTSPCRVCRGLPPPSECALPGAQKRREAHACLPSRYHCSGESVTAWAGTCPRHHRRWSTSDRRRRSYRCRPRSDPR